MINFKQIISLVTLILFSTYCFAVLGAETGKQVNEGIPADASVNPRVIKITQIEYMFLPNEIWVSQGETIRFIVTNKGDHAHEMLIGSRKDLKKAAKMRRMHPDQGHTIPGLIQLEPGEQKEMIWQFDQVGVVEFACPLPGHFKGMRGKIYVEKK